MDSNNLPTISMKPVTSLSVKQARRLSQLRADIEEHGFREFEFARHELAPTAEERAFLVERQGQITAHCVEGSASAVAIEVSGLYAFMGVEPGEEIERDAYLDAYAADLEGVPIFALRQAAKRFRRAEIGDGRFMPKVGELRKEALRIAQPFAAELTTIRLILRAKVPPRRVKRPVEIPALRNMEQVG